MKLFPSRSINTTFNMTIALLLVVLFLILAFSNYSREQSLIIKGAVGNARAISRQIIETRDYLSQNVTNEPDHNPSLIPQVAATRIAQRITSGSNYYVRQVSLRYRNPENRPDSFENSSLASFKNGASSEIWQVTSENGKKNLRYLMSMTADKSCLSCHGSYDTAPPFVRARFPRGHFSYGYRIGETIGAISVSIPMEGLYKQIGSNLKRDIIYDGLIMLVFLLITWLLIRSTILTPVKSVASHILEVARTGNSTDRLERSSTDEIGDLVGSFNELMAELDRRTKQRIESEERYRNFIEIARSPIITFMADGKIVISNQKAENLFGLSKEELLGLSVFEFMEQNEELRKAIDDYFAAGSSDLIGTTTRQRVRNVCGRLIEVEMVISVSQSDQNQMFTAILRAAEY